MFTTVSMGLFGCHGSSGCGCCCWHDVVAWGGYDVTMLVTEVRPCDVRRVKSKDALIVVLDVCEEDIVTMETCKMLRRHGQIQGSGWKNYSTCATSF